MTDLFPKPGDKPWNLNAFGTAPQPRNGYRMQVEANTTDTELAITRLHAFAQAVENNIRDLPAGERLDPSTLTISTHRLTGSRVYRATFTSKETGER